MAFYVDFCVEKIEKAADGPINHLSDETSSRMAVCMCTATGFRNFGGFLPFSLHYFLLV